MNVSSSQPCVSICCDHDMIYPSEARCYWNVSFSTKDTIFPRTHDHLWFSRIRATDLHPASRTICPNNTVCYSDCISEHNISTYLFGNNMISINDSIDHGLTCRLDAADYCYGAYVPDGTNNVISVCKTALDLLVRLRLAIDYMPRTNNPKFEQCLQSLSLLFFVATFIIYTIIPELKNLHGLMLRTYISCYIVYFLQLIIMFGPTSSLVYCNFFILILWHFSYLARYFWVNVMAFDIWWTFRSVGTSSEQSTRKQYIIYSIYAWGMPTLIIGIALILELDYYMGAIVIGVPTRCWMNDKLRMKIYVHGPAVIPVICNICLFALTTINIIRQKKAMAQCPEGSDSQWYNQEKKRFYLYLKLFILMGLPYIGDMLPFLLQFKLPQDVLWVLELPVDGAGLITFMIFVCNDQTKQLLAKQPGMKDWVVTRWINNAAVRIRTLIRQPQVS